MKRKHTHSLVTWALARLLWPCYSCLFILFNNIQLRINWNIKLQPTVRVNAFPCIQSTASKLDVGLQFVCWGSDAFWFWFWFGSGSKLSPTLMAGFRFSSLYSTLNYCTAPGWQVVGIQTCGVKQAWPEVELPVEAAPGHVRGGDVLKGLVRDDVDDGTHDGFPDFGPLSLWSTTQLSPVMRIRTDPEPDRNLIRNWIRIQAKKASVTRKSDKLEKNAHFPCTVS